MRVFLTALMALLPLSAAAATLTVKVENIDTKGGVLRLSLYNEASWSERQFRTGCQRRRARGSTRDDRRFQGHRARRLWREDLSGRQPHHKFDQNWLGWPLERYGFSRDAHPRFSEPGFDRTGFTLPDGKAAIVIHLQ